MESLQEKVIGGFVAVGICVYLACQLADAVLPEEASADLAHGIDQITEGINEAGQSVSTSLDKPLKSFTDLGEQIRKDDGFSKTIHKIAHDEPASPWKKKAH